ncbi:MAG: hypothetical protein LC772_10210, partial [Chloroflexi bacterium]|nr:hypothetical protein [Chloroflexota bacterium]
LMDQGTRSDAVMQAALEGRVRFTARDALNAVQAEQNTASTGLRDADRAAAEALAVQSRAERSISRAMEIAQTSAAALQASLGVRMAGGQDRFSRAIGRRLQEDPFSSLDIIRRDINEWWQGTAALVEAEAASYLVEIAALLQDAGCSLQPGVLPPLDLSTCSVQFEFSAVSDGAAPMKDTISGLLGSVSRSAADSAADWMNRASRAAVSRTARTRGAALDASEKLDRAFSLAGVKGRGLTAEWGRALASAVLGMAEPQASQLRDETGRRDRIARPARERMAMLTALAADLTTLAEYPD